MPAERAEWSSPPPLPAALTLPVRVRALAQERFPALGFADPTAGDVLARLGARAAPLVLSPTAVRKVLARTVALDAWADAFFAAHPDGLGVSLGAGLCTRPQRLGQRWVCVDAPEVIALRRELLPSSPARREVASAITDPDWLSQLGWRGEPVWLVAEGVLTQLPTHQVCALMVRIAERFGGAARLAFDYTHPWLSPRLPADATAWALRRPGDILWWHPSLRLARAETGCRGRGATQLADELLNRFLGQRLHGLAELAFDANPRGTGAGRPWQAFRGDP